MASTGGWNNPDFSTLKDSFALAPTLKDLAITTGDLSQGSRDSGEQPAHQLPVSLQPESIQI